MKNSKKIWRWLSVVPVAVSSLTLPSILMMILVLPLILVESILKAVIGLGPLGKVANDITNFLTGLDSTEFLSVTGASLFTGFVIIYVLSILIPKDNEKTSKILIYLFNFWFGFTLVILFINNGSGEDILRTIMLILGGFLGYSETKKQSELIKKHEEFVKGNIKKIFLSSLVVSIIVFVVYFFFI